MNEFRDVIYVFGERLRVVEIHKELNPDDWVISYRADKGSSSPLKVCHLSDWMEWDRAAREVRGGQQR